MGAAQRPPGPRRHHSPPGRCVRMPDRWPRADCPSRQTVNGQNARLASRWTAPARKPSDLRICAIVRFA
jgi:hypothetical protein